MSKLRAKYYVYADESGQHTRGQMFIVAVVCFAAVDTEALTSCLLGIEDQATRKGQRKWVKTPIAVRQLYLQEVMTLSKNTNLGLYYRIYGPGTDYLCRTADAIAGAIQEHQPTLGAALTVVVDGLNPAERQTMSRRLRSHTLPFSLTVRGGRDESTPLIRLVDGLAGFVRHAYIEEPYAKEQWPLFGPYLRKI